jgi:MPBQ/MSBQ methyltransferase
MRMRGTGLTLRPSARRIRNPSWSLADVKKHYSYGNPHADLYRYLSQWSAMGTYLNVGYSEPGQNHLHSSSHLRLIDRLARELLALHALSPHAADRRLLDIACGRGGPAIRAHRRNELKVVGIDLTPHNIRCAKRNSARRKLGAGVQFVVGSALALCLRDASFSLAWCIESPAHFFDKLAFLREAARVLKPGGVFAFADLLAVDGVVTASPENRRIYRDFLRTWDLPYLETYSGYRRAIVRAGFKLHKVEIATKYNLDILRRHCALFLSFMQLPLLYTWYRYSIKRRTGAELANVYEHVRKSYRALRLGMLDYGLFWAIRV